ncbi:MAG: cadherin-like domain-containing protein [Acidobacteriota bacterium]|nr:cadherin-like domain-containing protein [Acidobacteriota bacterium]
MRTTIILCLMFSLAAPPLAAQARRRAVRKTPPAGPIVRADSYAVLRGGTLVTAAGTGVLANDTDPLAKPLTAILVTSTSHGTLTLNADGGFTYAHNSSSASSDSFTYKASNGTVESSPATATITINDPPPQAADDSFSVNQNTTLNVPAPGALDNDTLNGATIASYGATSGTEQTTIGASTATTAGGTVRLQTDGSIEYNPAGGFSGSDSFRYILANAGGTSTATVTITVQVSNTIDFIVTSPGFFFQFSGVAGANPVLTLQRGRTYRFQINTAAIHPFGILDAPQGSVTNNNINNGILTFAVPAGTGNYRYHCTFHDFGNDINTTP